MLRHAGVAEDVCVGEEDVRHRQKRRDGASQLAADGAAAGAKAALGGAAGGGGGAAGAPPGSDTTSVRVGIDPGGGLPVLTPPPRGA
jgi:hypothetical protein